MEQAAQIVDFRHKIESKNVQKLLFLDQKRVKNYQNKLFLVPFAPVVIFVYIFNQVYRCICKSENLLQGFPIFF